MVPASHNKISHIIFPLNTRHQKMGFRMDSSIHGYHVYEEVWTATFGEQFYTEREYGYIVAVKKDSGETVEENLTSL